MDELIPEIEEDRSVVVVHREGDETGSVAELRGGAQAHIEARTWAMQRLF